MANGLALDFARSRIDDADLFVLARRHQFGAGPVEARAVHDIRMAVDVHQHLGGAHVPDDHLVVGAGGEQHILRGRMPQHESDASLVEQQIGDGLGDCATEAAVGDLPHLEPRLFRPHGILINGFLFWIVLH